MQDMGDPIMQTKIPAFVPGVFSPYINVSTNHCISALRAAEDNLKNSLLSTTEVKSHKVPK